MSNTTAADIRKAAFNSTVPSETVHIDEWDADVEVRGMTAGAAIDFYAAATKQERGETVLDQKMWGPSLLIACVFDPEGSPVFETASLEMIKAMPSQVVVRLAAIAARLSGLGNKADDKDVVGDFGDDL